MTKPNFSVHLEVFSRIKIWGEFWLSLSVFLAAQIEIQAISPIHKSETCTQTRVGGGQGWPQLGSLELGSSLASLTTIIEDYLQDRHRTGFYLQVDRAPEESAVVQRTETHILPAAM